MKRHKARAVIALLVLALSPTGTPIAADDRAFGAKPWLLSPAPERPTPLQKHRASVYRSALQREIRRLELKGPLTDIRSLDRRNSFRRELSRIERARRARQRR